jgi:hypothetical protein
LPVVWCGLSGGRIRHQQRIERQQAQAGNGTPQCATPNAATTAARRYETKHYPPRHPARSNAEADSVKTISDGQMMPVEKCDNRNAPYL